MNSIKTILKRMLFPPTVLLALILPTAVAALTYTSLFCPPDSVAAIASYVLSAYALTLLCLRLPRAVRLVTRLKKENKYAKRYFGDTRLRVNLSLAASLIFNISYAAFQLCLGIYHRSLWYCSMTAYYFSLALMRFFLVRHSTRHRPGERMHDELNRYGLCGGILLAMNLALSVIIFIIVFEGRSVKHSEITTIALAAYTFFTFAKAIVNVIRYRKYASPVFSASKAISLAAACVSMLTLESSMLATFGDELPGTTRFLFLGLSGAAVSIFIISMAIYMMIKSRKGSKDERKNGTKRQKL